MIHTIEMRRIEDEEPDPDVFQAILTHTGGAGYQILEWHSGKKEWLTDSGHENRLQIHRWAYLYCA